MIISNLSSSRAALQPEALRKTGVVVLENVNSTAHIVGGMTKKYAYEFQASDFWGVFRFFF